MAEKFALFAFNGDPMCFVHVMLNALDMKEKGNEVAVIIEGSATKLITTFHINPKAPFFPLWKKMKDAGLIAAVCKACATKMASLDATEAEGLPIVGEMSGHPSMTSYTEKGYTIITF